MNTTHETSEHQALLEGLLGDAATRALAYLRGLLGNVNAEVRLTVPEVRRAAGRAGAGSPRQAGLRVGLVEVLA